MKHFTSFLTFYISKRVIFQIGRLVFILDVADRIMFKVCPLATAGIVVGSIYWTAVTYGAVTVMQVHFCYFLYLKFLNNRYVLKVN